MDDDLFSVLHLRKNQFNAGVLKIASDRNRITALLFRAKIFRRKALERIKKVQDALRENSVQERSLFALINAQFRYIPDNAEPLDPLCGEAK